MITRINNFSKTLEIILLVAVVTTNNGCTSIGQNRQYALDYQCKEQKDKDNNPQCKTERQFKLTDVYDVRDATPVRKGDPINIIVNRVHIEDNNEDFYELINEAEIGVVLSVDDGTEGGGKDVLVSYDHGIEDKVDLPIYNLLAYSTTNYENQPIRVTVTVFEFDQQENEMLRGVLKSAANSVAAANPAYAPAAGLASQIGSYLISHNADDVVLKFTFTLYPWPSGKPDRSSKHFGVPRIRYGQFIVLNSDAEKANFINIKDDITVDWEMQVWKSNNNMPTNYLTLTVDDSTALANANQIISRADAFAREAAGIHNSGRIGVTTPLALNEQIEALGSSIRLFGATKEWESRKEAPEALRILWDTYIPEPQDPKAPRDPKSLTVNDNITLFDLIRRKLPEEILSNQNCSKIASKECKEYFISESSKYEYDKKKDRYILKGKNESSPKEISSTVETNN